MGAKVFSMDAISVNFSFCKNSELYFFRYALQNEGNPESNVQIEEVPDLKLTFNILSAYLTTTATSRPPSAF
jgi:hypothetical protein